MIDRRIYLVPVLEMKEAPDWIASVFPAGKFHLKHSPYQAALYLHSIYLVVELAAVFYTVQKLHDLIYWRTGIILTGCLHH